MKVPVSMCDQKRITLTTSNTEITSDNVNSTININVEDENSPWTLEVNKFADNVESTTYKTYKDKGNKVLKIPADGETIDSGIYRISAYYDDYPEDREYLTITKTGAVAIITKDYYSPYGDAQYSTIKYTDPNTSGSCN